jgi:hypothetical protein
VVGDALAQSPTSHQVVRESGSLELTGTHGTAHDGVPLCGVPSSAPPARADRLIVLQHMAVGQ